MAVFTFRTEYAEIRVVGGSGVLRPLKYRAKPPPHIRLSGAQPHFTDYHVVDGDFVFAGDRLCEGSVSPKDILKISGSSKAQEYLVNLDEQDTRLLSEFLGIKPYKPNGFTSQILISAINPETNKIEEYSVSRLNNNKDTVNARLITNPQGGIVKLPTEDIIVNKKLRPSWINYSDPLTNNVRGCLLYTSDAADE